MVYNTTGMVTMILMAVLAIASAAPTNTTSVDLSYCDEEGSTSTPLMGDKIIDELYADLDNTLDILRQLCLDHSEVLVSLMLTQPRV